MKDSLREFFSLFFHRGWQLIAILFDLIGILGVVDSYTLKWLPNNFSIPIWVWFLVVIVSTIIACFLVFNRKNTEYHSLYNKLTKASKIEETLSNLAKLREEGVTLRNDGMQLLDDGERMTWGTKSDDWNKRVELAIKSLSEPEAGIYHILDWVDFPIDNFLGFYSNNPKFMHEGKLTLDPKTFQHIMNLRMHSQRLRGLKDFVLKYSKDAVLTKLDSTTENGKLKKQTMVEKQDKKGVTKNDLGNKEPLSFKPLPWGILFFGFWASLRTVSSQTFLIQGMAWFFLVLSGILLASIFITPFVTRVRRALTNKSVNVFFASLVFFVTLLGFPINVIRSWSNLQGSDLYISVTGLVLWIVAYLLVLIGIASQMGKVGRVMGGIVSALIFWSAFNSFATDALAGWIMVAIGVISIVIVITKPKFVSSGVM